ncbi:type I secretion system permease/ATPase [Alphaproteobacteria bacterium]|nr:type I secretion system permease/ATPase [Alphaproteobacteria bacterium]
MANEETQEPLDDMDVRNADPLLECLVFLSSHHGRSKSAESLKAGLAYDKKGMGPNLFCEAAERLGLKTKITKRDKVKDIPSAVLPAVLILDGGDACILLTKNRKQCIAFFPDTKAETTISIKDLERDYGGYAIFAQPTTEFTNPEMKDVLDTDKHWFWGQIKKNRGIYAVAMFGAVFINLFALTSPLFIMNVYDRVIPNEAIETGWALGIGALSVFGFDFILRTLRAYLVDIAGRRIDVVSARRIYDHVIDMKLVNRPRSSGVFANMLRDFDSVREFFTSATITVLVDLPFSIFFIGIIYFLAGNIAFILAGLILAVAICGFLIQIKLKSHIRKSIKTSESKHGLLVETIHGLETIKAIGADGRFRAKYTQYLGDNAISSQQSRFWSGLGVNIATFLQQISSILIILFGMYLVRDGSLSVGGLIAAVMLGGRAIAPIGQIANLMAKYHQAGGALKTLDRIMSQPVERPPEKQFLHRPNLNGKIIFEDVSFAYPSVKQPVLNKVSFTINAGEKVGIIGRIGSGKSTIAKLAMGLYEPDDGTILIDDTDYRQIDPADLRRNTAYISQDVFLFTGSVRDNIAASVPDASEAEILDAAKRAGVDDFISRHPMGYDAPVGENGEGMSGGQRQAIALARAMLMEPNILVCDEPTNAMDMQAEAAFKNFVEKEIKGKTLVLVTHKPQMLPMVDRLILIDQGRVIISDEREKVLEFLKSGKIEVKA